MERSNTLQGIDQQHADQRYSLLATGFNVTATSIKLYQDETVLSFQSFIRYDLCTSVDCKHKYLEFEISSPARVGLTCKSSGNVLLSNDFLVLFPFLLYLLSILTIKN